MHIFQNVLRILHQGLSQRARAANSTNFGSPKYSGVAAAIAIIVVFLASRANSAPMAPSESAAHFSQVLVELIVILIAAKLGGDLLVRLGQPAVLGELIFGIVIGNLYLTGFQGLAIIRSDEIIKILSEIGVILLLFQVGLESDIDKMKKVGMSALLVASLGIAAPFFLGWGVARLFLPDQSVYVHIFLGATLCATSVGITARVLRDLGRIQTRESRIVLGAAVIDDIQGLVILAIVQGIIASVDSGQSLSAVHYVWIVGKAVLFLAGALVLGRWFAKPLFSLVARFKGTDLLLSTSLGICFVFAYIAGLIGLAPIVGAFAAGLILDEVHYRRFCERGEHTIDELIKPLAAFLVPVFFVRMGAEVDIMTLANPSVVGFALALIAVAIVSKQICGLGALEKGIDRLSIGIGMIPRGEVGLIFAAIGASLTIGGEKVVQPPEFAAVVIMVVFTTMLTPPLLKWSLGRTAKSEARLRNSEVGAHNDENADY